MKPHVQFKRADGVRISVQVRTPSLREVEAPSHLSHFTALHVLPAHKAWQAQRIR